MSVSILWKTCWFLSFRDEAKQVSIKDIQESISFRLINNKYDPGLRSETLPHQWCIWRKGKYLSLICFQGSYCRFCSESMKKLGVANGKQWQSYPTFLPFFVRYQCSRKLFFALAAPSDYWRGRQIFSRFRFDGSRASRIKEKKRIFAVKRQCHSLRSGGRCFAGCGASSAVLEKWGARSTGRV